MIARVSPAGTHLLSLTYENMSLSRKAYLLPKSFRREILRGYLEHIPFVFMDLAGNASFGVYTRYCRVNILSFLLAHK